MQRAVIVSDHRQVLEVMAPVALIRAIIQEAESFSFTPYAIQVSGERREDPAPYAIQVSEQEEIQVTVRLV